MPLTAATSFLVISLNSLVRPHPKHRDAALVFAAKRRRAADDEDNRADGEDPDSSSDSDSDNSDEEDHLTTRTPSRPPTTTAQGTPRPDMSSSSSHSSGGGGSSSSTVSPGGGNGNGNGGGGGNSGGNGGNAAGLTIDFTGSSGATSSPSVTTTTPSRTLPYLSQFSGSSFTASNGTVVPLEPTADGSSPTDPLGAPTTGLRLGNAAIVGITLGFVIFSGMILMILFKICKHNRRARKAPQGFSTSAPLFANTHHNYGDGGGGASTNLFASQHPPPGYVPPSLFAQAHHHPQLHPQPAHGGPQMQQHRDGQGQDTGFIAPEVPVTFSGEGANYASTTTSATTPSSSPAPGGRSAALTRSLSPFTALRISTPSPLSGLSIAAGGSSSLSSGAPAVPPGLGGGSSSGSGKASRRSLSGRSTGGSGGGGYLSYFALNRRGSKAAPTEASSQSSHGGGKRRSSISAPMVQGGQQRATTMQMPMAEVPRESRYPEADPHYLVPPPTHHAGTVSANIHQQAEPTNYAVNTVTPSGRNHRRSYRYQDGRRGANDSGAFDDADEYVYDDDEAHSKVSHGNASGSRHGHGGDPPPSYGQAF